MPYVQEEKILNKDAEKNTEWVLSSDELLWLENVIMKVDEELIFTLSIFIVRYYLYLIGISSRV